MVNYKLFWLEIFFQLPPIASELYGDPRFNTFFEHKFNFSIVHRPNYPDLIDCVNDLEMDDISDNSVAFLNSLNRPRHYSTCSKFRCRLFQLQLTTDISK